MNRIIPLHNYCETLKLKPYCRIFSKLVHCYLMNKIETYFHCNVDIY